MIRGRTPTAAFLFVLLSHRAPGAAGAPAPDAPAPPPPPPPPAAAPPPRVVVNEIYYHPPSDDPRDAWIELFNRSQDAVDLSGWRLGGDIEYTFPPGTTLPAQAFLVVAADRARAAAATGSERTAGDWEGALSRGRGRIRLLAEDGSLLEEVRYSDKPPFPVLPDGYGHSLERRCPDLPASQPANWGAAAVAAGNRPWRRIHAAGVATSNRVYFYLLGAGVVLLDELTLRPAGDGGDGGGEEKLEERRALWHFSGNHSESRWTDDAGTRSESLALEIRAAGPGGSSRASAFANGLPVQPGRAYELECWARFETLDVPLVVRFSGANERSGEIYAEIAETSVRFTPGAHNSIHSETLPPFVYPVTQAPARPAAGDTVRVSFTVRGTSRVELRYDAGDGVQAVLPARATGSFEVAEYTASLGPFAGSTLVRYWIEATAADGARGRFPFEANPTTSLGFFVRGAQEGTAPGALPVYHLFVPEASLARLNMSPGSDVYERATLVHDGEAYLDVGVRYRGQTSRSYPKHHLKIKLQRDHRFSAGLPGGRAVRSINLKSAFVDKAFVREKLAFDLWRDLGAAYCDTRFVTLYLNGEYFGLYLQIENPNAGFLERNGLEAGWLWKAYAPGHAEGRAYNRLPRRPGLLQRLFGAGGRGGAPAADLERATRFEDIAGFELEQGDPATAERELATFLRSVNELTGTELEAFLRAKLDVDSFVNYLAANQLVHNADHLEKNYLVYASPAGRFAFLPWDLDFTHGRNFECDRGMFSDYLRHDLWDEAFNDERLLLGTLVHVKCDGPWNAVINAVLGKTATFRPQYYQAIAEGLRHYYHPEVLVPKVRRLGARIREETRRDRERWGAYPGEEDFDVSFEALLAWIPRRYEHLRDKLAALGYEVGAPLNACFEAQSLRGVAPVTVRFANHSVGEIERQTWDFGDGGVSDEREPPHTYTRPGRFDVTLRVSGPHGEHAATRRELVLVEAPQEDD